MAKLSLWSRAGELIERITRSSSPADGLLDTAATADWVIDGLARWASHPVEYIVPVSHGAAIAGVRGGSLAFTTPDYEAQIAPEMLAAYRARRDAFAETGSPALPAGLNLGAQLFALQQADPRVLDGVTLMPYAQYWAWLLTGIAASEVTSLGCHSDLWNPLAGSFSPMARQLGWAGKFGPLVGAGDVVGTLKTDLADRLGFASEVKVLAGLHDSNAALYAARSYPEITGGEATVLSTGTWFVAMRAPELGVDLDLTTLPEARDCLVNVDVFGKPVPSARFMGGREIESLIEIDTRRVDILPDQPHLLAAVAGVLDSGAMVLPTLAPGTGPFPDAACRWVNRPVDWYARRAAACLYAALVADVSLDLIGSRENLLVEGRFAEAQVFVRALAALRPQTRVFTANAHTDVSFGALRLIDPDLRPDGDLVEVVPLADHLNAYKAAWHEGLGSRA
ncbi:FGGY-family carbohydrate kinase [Aurantiacibacter arachoides]|nr:carbohydrate kinase [Aurantiacibacter arachoides]GGD55854.1 carbohydrate kinase [Aurantiacibacter arachoides]